MKIGILTQPLHTNYGGVMQNWALQQVLKQLGHEPIMINRVYGTPYSTYCSVQIRATISAFVHRYFLGNTRHFIRNPFKRGFTLFYPLYCDTKFAKREISKTKSLYSDKDLRQQILKENFDAYIIGSDQVWREEYSPSIFNYFLSFLPENSTSLRIAYAASFGKSEKYISKDKMPRCCELLKHFDAISVREYEGCHILQRDFNIHDAAKVLDPTLLLDNNVYKKLIKGNDRIKSSHIVAYILDTSEEKTSLLVKIGTYYNLPIKIIYGEFKGKKMLTISQWLAEYESSDFIVTDSFHGCVFSIIFHKPFIAIANKDRGIDRFVSLLRDAGLENRLILSMEEFETRKKELLVAPDYKEVERRLSLLRTTSFNFLVNALKRNVNE